MKKNVVVGIGEILWDIFPSGKKLGGAPMNFAFHCSQFGAEGIALSAVGSDELGDEILEIIKEHNLDTSHIQRNAKLPTGTVLVELDGNGKPTYNICENVAWDAIDFDERAEDLAKNVSACCFGSLAQRSEVSRKSVQKFLRAMPANSLKIFDINLRQNFYSKELIAESLELANILKLSDDELPVLAELYELNGDSQEQLKSLREKFDLDIIIYSRGAKGSVLLSKDEISEHSGCEGKAINSVGAGDSFTATFCMDYLAKKPLDEINEHANQVATFVCMQETATPIFPKHLT
ncbi:MAG: carbohydrate kinase [Opitutales bacterium]